MFKHDFTIMIRYLTNSIFDTSGGITPVVENPLRDLNCWFNTPLD